MGLDISMPESMPVTLFTPHYYSQIKQAMQAHGGDLDANQAFFPPGVVKRHIRNNRYAVVFPDQFTVELVVISNGDSVLLVHRCAFE
jgi:hypothetical protein